MDDMGASLEHASPISFTKADSLQDVANGDEDPSENELPRGPQSAEERRQVEQRALQEIPGLSSKDNVNVDVAGEEKEMKVSLLEAEVQEMRRRLERVHSERVEAEKSKECSERRAAEMHAELEAAHSTVREVTAENQAQREICEKQQMNLNETLAKLEMQSRFLDSESVEGGRAKGCIELESRCQDLERKLADRDAMFRHLREGQEQLRLSFTTKEKLLQEEKEEVITALDASEEKSEEQRVKLKELENQLMRFKDQAAAMEKRRAMAETKAGESSALLSELQSKLDTATMELFELKDASTQVDILRMRLQECERSLKHATSQKLQAESSLQNLKFREEDAEEIEQGKNGLEERLKWRNEQFQSLEEAHAKVRRQFKEKRTEWDSERAAMLSEIDSLQEQLDSKARLLQESQNQLQMVHQALSHEESRRKVLELQAAESRRGLEEAAAGFDAAQSAIETLRDQTSTEIGSLRNAYGENDRQLKDLQVKYLHMEQEYSELKEVEKEYRAWQSDHGEQQKQFLALKARLANVVESHEGLRSRMKEQEETFEKERRELVMALDQANDRVVSKEEMLKQLGSELDSVKGALENVACRRSDVESQLKECMAQLEIVGLEAAAAKEALTSLETNSLSEKSFMLESMHAKDKLTQDLKARIAEMDKSLAELSMHEEKWLQMQRDYAESQQRHIQRDAERRELEKIHDSLKLRVSEEEAGWMAERENLVAELQLALEGAVEMERQLKDVHFKYDRHQDVILKLEAKCASHEKEVAEHCKQVDETRERLALERTEMEKVKKDALALQESLSAALTHKDRTSQSQKTQIADLEAELRRKHEESMIQNDRVALLEKTLKEKSEAQSNMHEHIAALKSQACEAAEELKIQDDIRKKLEEVLRRSREEQTELKKGFEDRLEAVHRECSIATIQLKAATQKLEEECAQKEALLKDLDAKEGTLMSLMEAKKTLTAEKETLHQVVHVLETRKTLLSQEVESSKTTINKLCNKYEAAETNLANRSSEVKELQIRLQNAHKTSARLLEAEERNKDLEGYLQVAKAIAQEKEEKLAASEWAVQQLALDVGKAKAALSEKERQEARMQYEMVDLDREMRSKEGALMEMECELDEVVAGREEMEVEVGRLRRQMGELERDAADWKRQKLDMTSQLDLLGAAVEEKREALVEREQQIKRGNDLRETMDGAIESLKLQLADEQKALSDQRSDMNRLCEDLEKSKGEANASAKQAKEMQGRLQQLEQSSDDRIKEFQSTVSELRHELSVAHVQLENYQNSTRVLAEESSRYREKCEALLDLNSTKDASLKDMEAQLLNVQAGALEQSKVLEQRDRDLQRAKEQRQYEDEKQLSLQESLSCLQGQRSELQIDNEELAAKLKKLTCQLDSLDSESALKSKEIEGLNIQLDQMRAIVAEEGETQLSMARLADDLQSASRAVREREARISALQCSLDGARVEIADLQEAASGKDSDMNLLTNKLSSVERRFEDTQAELSKMQVAMTQAQDTLTEKSGVIESQLNSINAMEIEIAEWTQKAGATSEEASSFRRELQSAALTASETQKRNSELQDALEGLKQDLKGSVDTQLLHAVSVEALERDLRESKEKVAAAMEEKMVAKTAMNGAEAMARDKDAAIGNLQEALERAEAGAVKYDSLVTTLQAELATFRDKEAAAEEEERSLVRQLEDALNKSALGQEKISQLQEALDRSGHELRGKTEQAGHHIASFNNLQEELLSWKSKAAGAESEEAALKALLEEAEGKELRQREEMVQMADAVKKIENTLMEEQRNVQNLATVENDLLKERIKSAESASLVDDLQKQVEQWKSKADRATTEVELSSQEVADVKKALTIERDNVQRLSRVERELKEEITKAVESASQIAHLQEKVEEWTLNAQNAAKEGKALNEELKCTASTVSTLKAQLQAQSERERSLEELNGRLEVSLQAAHEETLARREKMESIVHQLEQTQDSEKDLLDSLQMEHRRLLVEIDEEEQLDCEFEINKRLQAQHPSNMVNVYPTHLGVKDGEVHENFQMESQTSSSTDYELARLNETLEKELEVLRLRAVESQLEARRLADKLDAAHSTIRTKDTLIKQVNDEITGLKSVVKKLEQQIFELKGDTEQREIPAESTTTTGEVDNGQKNSGLGKRKAENQEELDHYVLLCDTLVRKNIKLEKQLDTLRRKNTGLQKQVVEGLQMMEKASLAKERRALDPVDCSSEQPHRAVFLQSNQNVFKSASQDICKEQGHAEIDENAAPINANSERAQMSRRPSIGSAAPIQQKKARRVVE